MPPWFERQTRFKVPPSNAHATMLNKEINGEPIMAPMEIITLPSEKYQLEEINIAGQLVVERHGGSRITGADGESSSRLTIC